MQLQTFIGREFYGIVFDGTFETAVEIALTIKEKVAAPRVRDFQIQNLHSQITLFFKVADSVSRRGEATVRNIQLQEGDCLVVYPNDYRIIKADLLAAYFQVKQDAA